MCEIFLKKEQKHTEDTFVIPKRYNYNYRERSIDDGSHFDPRLDKYNSESTLRRSSDKRNMERHHHQVPEKKISGLEKVKQLFSGGTLKKKSSKKSDEKEKSMVREEEMRARYNEYKGHNNSLADLHESKVSVAMFFLPIYPSFSVSSQKSNLIKFVQE